MFKKSIRSRFNIILVLDEDFKDYKILSYEETCTFNDNDIEVVISAGTFHTDTIFRDFNAWIQPDFVSPSLVCFPEYPFTIGLSYPSLESFLNFSGSLKSHTFKSCQQFEWSCIRSIIWTAQAIVSIVYVSQHTSMIIWRSKSINHSLYWNQSVMMVLGKGDICSWNATGFLMEIFYQNIGLKRPGFPFLY